MDVASRAPSRSRPCGVCHAVGCGCSIASGYVWDSADCSKPYVSADCPIFVGAAVSTVSCA